MNRGRRVRLAVWVVLLLSACAGTDDFDTDADRCRQQSSTGAQTSNDDFRLPEALDQTLDARVPAPAPGSAYALCMRSRGWKTDEEGKTVGRGLSAEAYSRLLAQELTICARRKDETDSSPLPAEAPSATRAVCHCLEETDSPGITSVDLHLVIGESGAIRRVTAEPESSMADCLKESLPHAEVTRPPSAPWKATVRILHYQ